MAFEKKLLEAIDDGLSVLGEAPKQMVYYHLEKTFNLNKQDIPVKIEEFANAIERIFGSGAQILEIQIMKSLFEKFGNDFKYYPKKVNITLRDYITALKLESENRNNEQSNQKHHNEDNYTSNMNMLKMANSITGDLQAWSHSETPVFLHQHIVKRA